MRRHIIILPCLAALALGLLSAGCSSVRRPDTEAGMLLDELLSSIDSAAFFTAGREAQLDSSKTSMALLSPVSREYYDACMSLGQEYSGFIADSSLRYYLKAEAAADALGSRALACEARMGRARTLIKTGYFIEAKLILGSLDRKLLKRSGLLAVYYRRMMDLNHAFYLGTVKTSEFYPEFVGLYEQYRDSLLAIIPEDSELWMRQTEKKYARSGQFGLALQMNDARMESMRDNWDEARALLLFDRYIIYFQYMGRPIYDHVEYVLESAVADVKHSNQDIASLRYVETYLLSLGDTEAAKKVSDYYYSTMIKLGSRTRILSGVKYTMRINDEYASMLIRQKRKIQLSLVLMVLLFTGLALILYGNITSRRKIEKLNSDLDRSGRISNAYVLGFFELYSSYIARLQAFKSRINLSLRKGNTEVIRSLTDPSKDVTNEELREMYNNFDKAFLDIFPRFVEDFNSLLRPECRIAPRQNELLNMDLRIFAVIKLGITDSAKISELLHCSIKTVYNKRSDINGKLLVPKEKFARELARM